MSFWSTGKFEKNIDLIIPDGANPNNIGNSCYDLTVGDEIFISPLPDSELRHRRIKKFTDGYASHIIPPGQFAYLITKETVHVPACCIGFISFKFQKKAMGLINVSGFHVNPGYKGKLVFALFNASGFNHPIKHGEKAFSLWISTLDDESNNPSGSGYTSLDDLNHSILNINDPISSLPVIAEQIKKLENEAEKNSFKVAFILGLLVPIDIALVSILVDERQEISSYIEFLLENGWVYFIIFFLLATLAISINSFRKKFKYIIFELFKKWKN